MTKLEAYALLSQKDPATSFLANVIFLYQRNAAKRLIGAAQLVQAGHQLCCAPFNMDVLWIDGQTASWTTLEARGTTK